MKDLETFNPLNCLFLCLSLDCCANANSKLSVKFLKLLIVIHSRNKFLAHLTKVESSFKTYDFIREITQNHDLFEGMGKHFFRKYIDYLCMLRIL